MWKLSSQDTTALVSLITKSHDRVFITALVPLVTTFHGDVTKLCQTPNIKIQ
jgi:hypothetical protein